jgi:hypothetical protein
LDTDRVVPELKKNEYPIEDVLFICKKNNAIEAQAYLLEKKGFYEEALE